MSKEALINNKANRENDFALGIAAESPQRSEDLERKARRANHERMKDSDGTEILRE